MSELQVTKEQKAIKGGEFLIRSTPANQIFIPEEFDEEKRMIAQTCRDFIDQEVYPKLEDIDKQSPGLMEQLLDKAGELGLLGSTVSEEYGGIGLDLNSSMLVTEVLGAGHSFAVAISAHTNIGTLPILYFGNEEQKQKYLPKLTSGEWKSCYCLTEPNAGSDANSGKTKATPTEDGKHYLITGQKMWITNGGFADLFIVFAKIEDDKNLSAFIVEKDFGGIELNPEEHKMGIKGSSTRQVFFHECKVPAENLLGGREKGFKIAVNILNIGRIKLGAAAIGACKEVIKNATKYANEREQFGTSIGNFGAIKHKLGEMLTKTYASESACYRAGQDIDDLYHSMVEEGMEPAEARLKATEEFAIECAIMKVHGSETLDYVTDEGVQIYGGMGYSADAPMERAYRDSRINRIFEGTNEINRMLAVGTILKRGMQGRLNVMGPAQKVAQEIMSIPDMVEEPQGLFGKEYQVLGDLKKALLMVSGAAVQKFMTKFEEQQEIMMHCADMLIEIYVAESTLLRTEKLVQKYGEEKVKLQITAAQLYFYEAVDKINKAGKEGIMAFAEGDEQRAMLMGLKRFTKYPPVNAKEMRRKLADAMLAENKYIF